MSALGTRSLTLEIDGDEVAAEVSKAVISSKAKESDSTTFADAASGGGREYSLDFDGVQDLNTGSLWDKVWSAAGDSVAFLLKPYGNSVASASQPHYSGNVTITEPDGDFIGGEADSSTSARMKFSCSWVCDAKPTKITS